MSKTDSEKLRDLAYWLDGMSGYLITHPQVSRPPFFSKVLLGIADSLDRNVTHLPSCNTMQDWSEAETAFADTPTNLRGAEWNEARNELDVMRNRCTCKKDSLEQKDPSDEEIDEQAEKVSKSYTDDGFSGYQRTANECFVKGAEWVRAKMQGK